MWYVRDFTKFLQPNENLLRTKGEQFKQEYHPKTKTLQINHITNHRVNTYLSEAQHDELTNL